MRTLKRNQRTIYYCLRRDRGIAYDDNLLDLVATENEEPIQMGDNGSLIASGQMLYNGDDTTEYGEPQPLKAYVSSAGGSRVIDRFGSIQDYDRVIITDWVDCPIDENSVLFVEKQPEFGDGGEPIYDYIVMRVSREFNHVTYFVRRVTVA